MTGTLVNYLGMRTPSINFLMAFCHFSFFFRLGHNSSLNNLRHLILTGCTNITDATLVRLGNAISHNIEGNNTNNVTQTSDLNTCCQKDDYCAENNVKMPMKQFEEKTKKKRCDSEKDIDTTEEMEIDKNGRPSAVEIKSCVHEDANFGRKAEHDRTFDDHSAIPYDNDIGSTPCNMCDSVCPAFIRDNNGDPYMMYDGDHFLDGPFMNAEDICYYRCPAGKCLRESSLSLWPSIENCAALGAEFNHLGMPPSARGVSFQTPTSVISQGFNDDNFTRHFDINTPERFYLKDLDSNSESFLKKTGHEKTLEYISISGCYHVTDVGIR